jgi:periplasmic glucans biosynthesis protein
VISRILLFALFILAPLSPAVAQVETAEVNLEYVTKLAEARAKEAFHSPRANMPEVLRPDKLNYDNYRKIRFRSDRAFWLGDHLPFRAEFFHPGYIYQEPVRIFEFTRNHVQRIRFVRDWFNYSDLHIDDKIPADTGYAGFKIAHPLNGPAEFDEVASFLGASYFRMLGKSQRYGESARGLALDCGAPDRPEEFPLFTDFWLGKPARDDTSLLLYALLDSVSCTGAYEIRITPGETTVAAISAALIFREPGKILAANKERKPLSTIGLAPLTSMFWFGENSERKFDDYRPEVHDSDGLLLHMDNGEIIWRPLNNASVMRHSVFATTNIRGFGLLQRDRDFSHYEELFNPYNLTPSVWVKPDGDWGEGEVHLVELPTNYEGMDNIVAFWNPKQKPAPLQPFRIAYQLLWTRETDFKLSTDRVVSTRIGADGRDPKKRQAHLDFAGDTLDAIPAGEPPEAAVSCSPNARIYETQVLRDSYSKTWRVILKFEPTPDNRDPVELRCALKRQGKTVSETWAYLWSPM